MAQRGADDLGLGAVGPPVASLELITSVTEHQRQLAQALVDKAKAICAEHGVDVETVFEVGDPKETICQAAHKLNVDLLILGSQSRGPIQRYSTLMEYLLQSAEEQNCSNQQQHIRVTWISGRGALAARAEEQQQLVLQVQWKTSKLISEK
ncbi:Universal stress protein A-like protein [Hordeum vulgare]|nr:Universal stress protein A-like protein [Hordeum vulgare]